jgi:predicted DNA-binding protein (MmcQ/YjbR family)
VTLEEVEAHCLSLPGATKVVQWGGTSVFKVGGKIFTLAGGAVWSVAFKASDLAFELLPEQGVARPARYLGRARWLELSDPDAFSDDEVRGLIDQAHAIVAAKLTRKARAELGL